ncbi:DeoR/GlpR family DNA-binding transcription regulator [Pelagicoccus albus]|uniref:DeoR/GlpR transcriptional regulator n=1 Tax=Pelagicoccus albus TaxID=415222 RepID=A0A7X1B4E5_9BACT|nr:DeoR/GlpR family DNA-binding transcription regulator [Pelagicoccus albus]MBC2605214.1 DeoR/GlpR transcriptional regulator [Pelagicoccus albus]
MLAPERQQIILSLIEDRGTVRTVDLAAEFEVTDETIRRDLQALSETHQLKRIHGGAASMTGRPRLQSFNERQNLRVDDKIAIAQAASDLIQPGQTYAFDSSTTAFALVSALPDQPFRVVTNSFAVIEHVSRLQEVELVSTGGRYHRKTHTFVGGETIDTLRRHNVHTAFLSCIGYDLKRGASEGFEQQATFKTRLVEHAERVVLLVDSSKFNKRSEYFFASTSDISEIITDSGADPELVNEIRSLGSKVTIAQSTPATNPKT